MAFSARLQYMNKSYPSSDTTKLCSEISSTAVHLYHNVIHSKKEEREILLALRFGRAWYRSSGVLITEDGGLAVHNHHIGTKCAHFQLRGISQDYSFPIVQHDALRFIDYLGSYRFIGLRVLNLWPSYVCMRRLSNLTRTSWRCSF
jgi:hypothetical protein